MSIRRKETQRPREKEEYYPTYTVFATAERVFLFYNHLFCVKKK